MAEPSIMSTFMAPLWWIQAFELALQLRRLEADPYSMSMAAGLSPALTDAELSALLVLMQQAQQQILQGQKWLHLSPDNLQKNLAGHGRTRSFLFLRVLQILRSMQVYPAATQEQFEPVPLFDREERRRDAQGSWKTVFRPAPMAAELLLGYGEPYAELARLLDGKPRVHRLLGRSQPLPLRPSVWLDLVQLEQFVFLQLQKATLWEKSSFRWDSVFGRSFENMFNGLSLPVPREPPENWSPFRQKMRLLTKVGRKLMDHGVLKNPQELDYLAVEQDSDPLLVVWQMNDTELREGEMQAYEQRCARYFREHTMDPVIKKITPIMAPSSGLSTEACLQLWRELDDAERAQPVGYMVIEGNLLLSYTTLFYEWTLRQKATDILRLPGWLAESAAVHELNAPKKSLNDRLQAFARILNDHSTYARDMETLARASLAAPVSWRQREVLEFLASHSLKSHLTRDAAEADESSRRAAPARNLAPPAVAAVAATRKAMPDTDLRRQANEELQKMRDKDPKRYQGLKQLYLDNLELEKKQIILEMKERMQPQAFDDHLKYSLVKYMVENPRSWQIGEGAAL
ncbi:MAG TPA: hypothetical protein VE954_13355 [Oligoflexus sp.]|uniref:hypothetical protein n=1 Tax=Oligoflexus sp. TaxID=1971216 RepID=UPI002D35A865|nr:hypothetical protein [Oligoflexus sp.]HYX34093.1 hypothetical protein [Oligoflexus sp.]